MTQAKLTREIFPGLVNHLLVSAEYLEAFGRDQVLQQGSRVLARQAWRSRSFHPWFLLHEADWGGIASGQAATGTGNV